MIDPQMIAKMDGTLVAYWGAYGHADGGYTRDLPDLVFSHTPIPLHLFNTVMVTGDTPASVDTALALAADRIAETGRAVLWRLGTLAQTDRIRSRLERAGLRLSGSDPAMLCDLATVPPLAVDGLTIEPVSGTAALRDWGSLTCEAFELGDAVRDATSRCEAGIPAARRAGQHRYLGRLDGKPVAVSSLVMVGDLAGIYAVATLPEARQRGIGTAMTLHAMAEGKRNGARAATLQASAMGRPVYERIGFSLAGDYECYLQG